MTRDQHAIVYGLGAVALWSTVATALKLALSGMTPVELMWRAAIVSWLLMGGWMIRRGLLSAALRRGWKTALWAGLINPVGYYLVLFAAYDRLPGQEAMALNYTWAITMALLAVPVLGHRLTRFDILAGLTAYAGVWVIATRGAVLSVHFADPVGVLFALASTLFWVFYWLLNVRDRREPEIALWQNFTVGLPVLTVIVALGPGFSWHGASGWGASIYVGLCEMGVAYLLWQQAVRQASRAAKVSTLILLSPPVSLLLLHFVVGEPLRPSTLVGLALILAGLGLQQLQVTTQASRAKQ